MKLHLEWMSLCWLLSVACPLYSCPEAWVRFTQRSNQVCDIDCMTAYCGFDSVASHNSPCLAGCESHCATSRLGDGVCDSGED